MSVEEDNRQEWTFTLYDFDNNGKVTREVITFCSEKKKGTDIKETPHASRHMTSFKSRSVVFAADINKPVIS